MDAINTGAAVSMVMSSNDIQASMIMKLINGGASVAAPASSSGPQLRTAAMQAQGIGQNLNVTA